MLPEQACRAGHRPAVVAVDGGHQHGRSRLPAALGPLGKGPLDRPGRAQRLERGQPKTARLVLDDDPTDAQLSCE
ncbi:hypothetical protein TNCT6_73410 [Streptomyces sp. 6-11-2]|nr:hypothetical protein TNCT6_73410 [Streptomyces sp. 6-11-2]